ncbi:cyclophilin-like protein [Suhomyces tanzawaensis NRRL Y-17324]|uniref:Cyclophilin-like protein n=1 Tax=Suhomyces tanzawaensis NRRL Y-17324 TaxID=984487 RepID=A0A1E4SRR4_9ASCO|nr:cyclophilin-like protein [Suhomyces tanzawaensis NRRL Y-17324]ODV82127.1 cyclophilin-like protein [Suhomyces tanzawaensis NRRL Y-17324]
MSEPATTASLTITTTKGEIQLELWAKEVPETSRQFLQNCIDKKYHNQPFGTITSDLVQTTLSLVSYHLRNEYHSRIRFKKGLLAAARENENANHNHSVDEFFITLKQVPFHNRYIVFGRVVGESIYNVVKIGDSDMGESGPLYPAIITDVVVHESYFDLIPSVSAVVEEAEEPPKKKPKKTVLVKLAFEEDEDDEEDSHASFKMKSAHEVLNDKRLSRTAVVPEGTIEEKATQDKNKDEGKLPEVDNEKGTLPSHKEAINPDNAKYSQDITTIILDKQEVSEIGPSDEKSQAKTSQPAQLAQPSPDTKKLKPSREPYLDSDYDSNLDLSGDEHDSEAIHKHRFGR